MLAEGWPFAFPQVLLLDEITVDLDVLGRSDLLSYLVEETEQRKSTIIYVSPSPSPPPALEGSPQALSSIVESHPRLKVLIRMHASSPTIVYVSPTTKILKRALMPSRVKSSHNLD
jgi:hypothetical protein